MNIFLRKRRRNDVRARFAIEMSKIVFVVCLPRRFCGKSLSSAVMQKGISPFLPMKREDLSFSGMTNCSSASPMQAISLWLLFPACLSGSMWSVREALRLLAVSPSDASLKRNIGSWMPERRIASMTPFFAFGADERVI